jgi:hypothetical protein
MLGLARLVASLEQVSRTWLLCLFMLVVVVVIESENGFDVETNKESNMLDFCSLWEISV